MARRRKSLNSRQLAFITGALVIVFIAGAVIVSREGRKSVGITEAQIPAETKEFLQRLAEKIGDLQFLKREGSGKDRTNKQDDEEAVAGGFSQDASENFIVYYHAPDESRARQILDFAEGAKERMLAVFEHFPYAKDKNGRKLPVYLASSVREYYELSRASTGSVACVKTIIYDDALVATMYVSPGVFARGGEYPRQVITHEVAHYTHFDIIDFDNIRNIRAWFIEGLASYTAQEAYRLGYVRDAYLANRIIPLAELEAYSNAEAYNPKNAQMVYAEGHSVIQMVEDRYGRRRVTNLVVTASRRTDFSGAAREALNLSLIELNAAWMNYLAGLSVRDHPSYLEPAQMYLRVRSTARLPETATPHPHAIMVRGLGKRSKYIDSQ
jgi:hypothetical protein